MCLTVVLAACAPPTLEPISLELASSPTPVVLPPTPVVTVTPSVIQVGVDPDLPEPVRNQLKLPQGYEIIPDQHTGIELTVTDAPGLTEWVYAVAVPFFTVQDGVASAAIRETWQGKSARFWIALQEKDLRIFEKAWGEADPERILLQEEVPDPTQFRDQPDVLLLLPFDELTPEWKVLQVDGLSPLEKTFDPEDYPLTIHFGFRGDPDRIASLTQESNTLSTNRDTDKMTVLVMTGTTALTRAIGYRMEEKGITYPAEKIGSWLRSADLTHISNEVSFTDTCPPADFDQTSMVFCSRPEYIGLLDDVSADVIELTGNHNLDWGVKPYLYSLSIYPEHQMQVYGGGVDRDAASQPLLITDHGNRLAFLGCNYAGPPTAVADVSEPGAAFCNYTYFEETISRLKSEGYLPVMTIQHYEYYHTKLSEKQVEHFRRLAEAGAVIVQGSQAHFPQPMEFYQGGFIHYGLGNLFFDQMDIPAVGTRREFIDRYVIYDGRIISIQLLTAMLEDYSQPRPMTITERRSFLEEIFLASAAIPTDQ